MSFEAILWRRALGILKFQTIYVTKKTTNLETKKSIRATKSCEKAACFVDFGLRNIWYLPHKFNNLFFKNLKYLQCLNLW